MTSFFKRFISVFLFFSLVGFIAVSCSKKETPAVIDANQNDSSNNLPNSGGENDLIVEDATPQGNGGIGVDGTDVFDKTSDLNSQNYNQKVNENYPKRRANSRFNSTKLDTVKRAYRRGDYRSIIGTKFSRNQLLQAYYKGLSYYNLAVQVKSNRLKKDYLIKAKKILKKVGNSSANTELSSRAIFWYGLINFRFPKLINDGKSKDALTRVINGPFNFILEKYPNTRVNNDAALYKGMTYHRYGSDKELARPYYEKLISGPQDDLVYHFKRNKMYPPANVARYYLGLLNKKRGGNTSRNNVPYFDSSKELSNNKSINDKEISDKRSGLRDEELNNDIIDAGEMSDEELDQDIADQNIIDAGEMSDEELDQNIIDIGEVDDVQFEDDGFLDSDTEVDEDTAKRLEQDEL